MHSNIKVRYLFFPFLLLIFLLQGCGSGGGGGDEPTPIPPDDDDPPPADNINQGLTGYLYKAMSVSAANPTDVYPVIIDLATGKSHRILQPLILDKGYSSPYPSNDGRTLVLSGDNEECSTTFDYYYSSCVFLARQGQPIEMLHPMDISSSAKISPNGEMLAAIGSVHNNSTSTALRLISLEGELLQTVADSRIQTFTWLPDGRLMFVWDNTFYLTDEPYDLNATAVYTHNSDEGISSLSPSHDGTRIAFIVSGANDHSIDYAYVMVMNIDGNGLRQLTDSVPDDIDPGQYNPVWSPDDRWVMVSESLSLNGSVLYAVRSSATRVILEGDQYAPGDAIKIQTDLYDHMYSTATTAIQTAWLSEAPFLNTSARPSSDSSETSRLPQNLSGEWVGPCHEQDSHASKTTLRFDPELCTKIEQSFNGTNCAELVSESETSASCHAGETLITDSGLTATQLFLEDDSVLAGQAIIYRDGDLLYVGQGSALDLGTPYTLQSTGP